VVLALTCRHQRAAIHGKLTMPGFSLQPAKGVAERMAEVTRRFRIEAAGNPAPETLPDPLAELSSKLDEIRDVLRPARNVIIEMAEAYRRDQGEAAQLRAELENIRGAIEDTRQHVSALRARSVANIGVETATGELGAVVSDTEAATHTILSTTEKIEMLAGVLQSEVTVERMRSRADEIALHAQSIYEACNFQDLTGQRIARVCETLDFVSSRVARMIDAWGGADAIDAIVAREVEALARLRQTEGTHALANGPRLTDAGDGHVDQSEIDSLFD
jgi:chemotaxis protein CheZ